MYKQKGRMDILPFCFFIVSHLCWCAVLDCFLAFEKQIDICAENYAGVVNALSSYLKVRF
jgi:hypothetical protein